MSLIEFKMRTDLTPPESIVKEVAAIDGPVDLYCWYEGPSSLPVSGAEFMSKKFFAPLYRQKSDAKVWLYSLEATNYKRTIMAMKPSTPLGEAINKINNSSVECIWATSFYRYCTQFAEESPLYRFWNEEIPKKTWLLNVSEGRKKADKTIGALFENRRSLFDSIKEWDVAEGYSAMQYVEGYYLIQESIKNSLALKRKKVEVVFALPNDESKYYRDYVTDIERCVKLDFGEKIKDIAISVRFTFFSYGDSLAARPYIDKRQKAPMVKPKEVAGYFEYFRQPFFRDRVHNLSGEEG